MSKTKEPSVATAFASLVKPIKRRRIPTGPSRSKHSIELMAFDAEQRHGLAVTQRLAASLGVSSKDVNGQQGTAKGNTAEDASQTLTAKQREMKERMARQKTKSPKNSR